MIQKWVLLCVFLVISRQGFCQDYTSYINLYKNIAIAEMMRTGIPASIKLAQGMLESNCGKSDLACQANNHFGIKCGNDWSGKCFKKEDDDFEDGKLVKSCFRQFSCVNDSYIAHSDFLTDPAKANRYGFLFDLKPTDYKGWAKGLAKAGYATDPRYADRLIDLIEKYQLYQFDTDTYGIEAYASSEAYKSYRPIRYYNDIKYVVANQNDSPLTLAAQFDLRARQIVKYNDDINDEQQILVPGSRVYLQPKRNKYNGHQKYHMLKAGEDLVSVSQKYGIKMSALLKRNGLAEGQIPSPNQKLVLKGRIDGTLRMEDPYRMPVVKEVNDIDATANKNGNEYVVPPPVVMSQKQVNNSDAAANKNANKSVIPPPVVIPAKQEKTDTVFVKVQKPAPLLQKPAPLVEQHTVSKGETLYSIARAYGISVTELKNMNNLSADTISIGQKLLVQ